MYNLGEVAYWYNLLETYFIIGVTWIIDHFRDFAWIVRVAAISVTISIGLIGLSMFHIIKNAWKRRKWGKTERKLREKYGSGIDYILSNAAPPKMTRDEELDILGIDHKEDDTRKLLKDKREKLSMARIIYRSRISEDASVEGTRNLHVLLSIFGTVEYLEELIVKAPMHMKAEALSMLRAFKIPTNQWIANQLMNSKRRRVKRLAMYSSILSSSNTDLGYFESEFFGNNFCTYDEIQLGFVLQRRQYAKRKIPNLAHWALIQKDPKSQAMFIRMMRQFNQKESCAELEEIFHHETDSELIEEVARTWGYLKYTEGEELMKDMLLTQPDNGKIAIMHALARLNTGESLQMFLDVYRNSGTPMVKFEALRSLYWYGEEGRKKFEEIKRDAPQDQKFLFDFFENPLTKRDIPLERSARYHSDYGDNLFAV